MTRRIFFSSGTLWALGNKWLVVYTGHRPVGRGPEGQRPVGRACPECVHKPMGHTFARLPLACTCQHQDHRALCTPIQRVQRPGVQQQQQAWGGGRGSSTNGSDLQSHDTGSARPQAPSTE